MSLPCKFLISLNAKKKKNILCSIWGEKNGVVIWQKETVALHWPDNVGFWWRGEIWGPHTPQYKKYILFRSFSTLALPL